MTIQWQNNEHNQDWQSNELDLKDQTNTHNQTWQINTYEWPIAAK